MKAIIIDDNQLARATLKVDLENYAKNIQIVGEAGGVIEGAKLLRKTKADVVFLDIQMQDGNGFDLLDILQDLDLNVVFISASDVHAIKAFRYAAVDYLVKPIDPDELIQALERIKYKSGGRQENLAFLNDSLQNNEKDFQRLALHSQEKIHVVEIAKILRCESNVNYTEFYFTESKRIVVSRTLKEFDTILKSHGFYRVHQSHLVNTKMIKEFVKIEGGHLIMIDGKMIPVSSRKRAEVVQMLENL